MKKHKIGIVGWKTGENSFGATVNYLEWISSFGNPVIIMPHEKRLDVDLLVLPGGMDVSSSTYGQIPGFRNSNPDLFKEHFMRENLGSVIESNIPIFGICLGHQMLNVHFGGSLTQNLLYHPDSPQRWAPAHDIFLGYTENGLKGPKCKEKVNSHHHQAIGLSNLSPDMEILAVAEGDNEDIVEAMYHGNLQIASVQWHPKFFGAC